MLTKKAAKFLIVLFTLIATTVVTTASAYFWHQPKVPKELLKKQG